MDNGTGARRLAGLALTAPLLVMGAGCGDTREMTAPERTPVEYGGGEFTQRIRSGVNNRAYLVVVPPSARPEEPAPVLLVFHGTGQSVESIRAVSDMDRIAGQRGWIVVYPRALLNQWAVSPAFFPATAGQNDVVFARNIISYLNQDLNIDRERIYAIGFSNGGLMAQRVACDMGDAVAASVSVASTMSDAIAAYCPINDPMPVLFFLGDEDGQFEWEGEVEPNDREYGGPGTAEWWAEQHGCPVEPEVSSVADAADDGTTVERWRYAPCSTGAHVEFYAIYGGGHTWPGSPVMFPEDPYGRTTRDISAGEVAVEFLEEIRRGD